MRTASEVGGAVVSGLLILALLGLVVGQLLGQPVGLAYVTSDSMEPSIDTGDGFIAIPAELSSQPEPGDVVTFEAVTVDGGGLTTHRIVDEREDGYVTRGDNSPFTDQDGGEPPLTEDRIVAHVLTVNDDPVTVPQLGVAVSTVRSGFSVVGTPVADAFDLDTRTTVERLGLATFLVGLVAFGYSLASGAASGPTRSRRRLTTVDHELDMRAVIAVVLVLVLVPANAAMLVPSGTTELVVDGAEAEESGIAPGEPVEAELDSRNNALITMVVAVEPTRSDVRLDRSVLALPPGESGTATATVPAPPPDDVRSVELTQRRYVQLLPESTIVAAHERSPAATILLLNAFVIGSVIGLIGGILGFGRATFRETDRDVPLRLRIRRRL